VNRTPAYVEKQWMLGPTWFVLLQERPQTPASNDILYMARVHGSVRVEYMSVNKESLSQIPFYSIFNELPVTSNMVLCL